MLTKVKCLAVVTYGGRETTWLWHWAITRRQEVSKIQAGTHKNRRRELLKCRRKR